MSVSSIPQRALVVGGTSGIGQGIALALAKRDVEVIVVGRSKQRGEKVVEQLSALSPSKNKQHSFQSIDAFDLSSVKDVAAATQNNNKQIDFLVMTQGMATVQGYTPTVNGIDQKLQLHYFSRFYLTKLMAPHMKEGSRVLTVLSAGVHGKYKKFDEDFELKDNYSIKNAADAAGYYTDAGFEGLSEEFPSLIIAHAQPGFVATNWGTEMPWLVRTAIRPLQSLFGRSLEECGEKMTQGCVDISTKGFHLLDPDGKPIEGGIKHTPAERDVIWEKTLKLFLDL
jgi:NAD(P)-dependent dehydrogenase (short-subunit alcohol dehydrogenase family)